MEPTPAQHSDTGLSSEVVLGARVRIGPGARLLAPAEVDDRLEGDLKVGDDVVVGPGALIAGARSVGPGARIEPGAVVTSDVPPHAIVSGNPARVVGYTAPPGPERAGGQPLEIAPPDAGGIELVGGARFIRLGHVSDLRGELAFGEINEHLPFAVERVFFVYDVPSAEVRGEHAHRTLHEILICANGSVRISLTDTHERQEVVLNDPSLALHIPPLVWSTQFQYSPGAVLTVLCSEPYDPVSYVRDFDEYLDLVQ